MARLSLVLASVLLAGNLNAELYRGDACTFIPTRELGTCGPLGTCTTARAALRAGKEPQHCSYEGTVPIVCCTKGSQIPLHGVSSATTRPKTTTTAKSPVKVSVNPFRGETCPPLPEDAAYAQKRGQKAWDKCIDLASSVYPCVADGYTIIPRFVRGNECGHLSTPLIVGGNATGEGEFPHMAALGHGNKSDINWNCGGSLISEEWVMTAAHCLREVVQYVRLGGGDSNAPWNSETHFTVVEIVKHPQYILPAIYNDIALLKLDKKVTYSKLIRAACLHTGEAVDDSKALVSGWGATAAYGKQSNTLLKTTVEKFSLEDCSLTNPPFKPKLKQGIKEETQICFGHSSKKQDTCQGDSGGPVQIYNNDNVDCTYLVVGITSNGKVCGEPGYPAIYTRVSAFIPWIESIVWP